MDTRIGEAGDDGADGAATVVNDWRSEARRAIGAALLDARRPLTSAEIAAHLRGDQSNVRKLAEQMASDGVLLRHTPPRREKGRGRQPRTAYSLAKSEVASLKAQIEKRGEDLGSLRLNLQLLQVNLEEGQGPAFFQIIDNLAEEIQMQWVGRIDGPKQPYLIALDGDDAQSHAEVMREAFYNVEIDCHRYSVTEIRTGKQFVERSRSSLRLADTAMKNVGERAFPHPTS